MSAPVAPDALPTPSECPSNPPTPTGPQRGAAMSEDKTERVPTPPHDCSLLRRGWTCPYDHPSQPARKPTSASADPQARP